ncbi:MAG: hypothetical protein QN229_03725 [Desulfurococcaceae archaeon TW002]
MSKKTSIKKVISTIVVGVLTGIFYYFIYVVLLPTIFSRIFPDTKVLEVSVFWLVAFVLFTGLGIVGSLLREHPVSLPLRLLTKILGALIVLILLNFGMIKGEVVREGTVIEYSLDISLPLYTIILFSMLMFP